MSLLTQLLSLLCSTLGLQAAQLTSVYRLPCLIYLEQQTPLSNPDLITRQCTKTKQCIRVVRHSEPTKNTSTSAVVERIRNTTS